MASLITIIDEDSLQAKVFQIDELPKPKRRIKAVELAVEFAKEQSPHYKGKIEFDQYADKTAMTIVSYKRAS